LAAESEGLLERREASLLLLLKAMTEPSTEFTLPLLFICDSESASQSKSSAHSPISRREYSSDRERAREDENHKKRRFDWNAVRNCHLHLVAHVKGPFQTPSLDLVAHWTALRSNSIVYKYCE